MLWTRRYNFENHAEGFCRKSKTIQNFRKKFHATNCSSGHVEGSFDKFLTFFGKKSEKFFAQNPEKFRKEEEKKLFQATNCSSGHVEGSFLKLLEVFLAKSPKSFRSNFEKNSEKKTKTNYFFRIFYSGHVDRILRTMTNVSAENPKQFKTI